MGASGEGKGKAGHSPRTPQSASSKEQAIWHKGKTPSEQFAHSKAIDTPVFVIKYPMA